MHCATLQPQVFASILIRYKLAHLVYKQSSSDFELHSGLVRDKEYNICIQ